MNRTISSSSLRQLMLDVFGRLGVPPEDAATVAGILCEASLSGYDSHGVVRVAMYAGDLRQGRTRPEGELKLLRESAGSAHLDAGFSLGPLACVRAFEIAAEKARASGCGCVTILNCTDVARLGSYVGEPAQQGLVALMMVNDAGGNPAVAPLGGSAPFLSTNPVAVPEDQNDMIAELEAMKTVAEALASLETSARARVLRWATDRFGDNAARLPSPAPIPTEREEQPVGAELAEYSDLADLFSAAAPRTDALKVLVAAYWLQVAEGRTDVDSFSANQKLKDLGHGVSNVTRAFDSLISQRPQPVVQTRKSGPSRQARKKYKLTAVGKQRIEEMANESAD